MNPFNLSASFCSPTLVQQLQLATIPTIREFSESADFSYISLIGHSFGGATAMTTIARKPQPFSRCVVLDPAFNFASDDFHHEVLPSDLRSKFTDPATIDTAARSQMPRADARNVCKIPLLAIYSEEWLVSASTIPSTIMSMIRQGHMGAAGSRCLALRGSTHITQADAGLLISTFAGLRLGFLKRHMPPDRITANIRHLVVQFLSRPQPQGPDFSQRPELAEDILEGGR